MEIVELFKNHLHSPSPLEVDGQSRWWLLSGEPVIPAHLPSLTFLFFFQLCLFSLPSDGKESSFFSVFFFFTFRCVLYLNVAVRFVSVRGKTSHGITEKTSKPNPRARLMVNGLETIYPFRLRARLALPAAERFVFSAREYALILVVRKSVRDVNGILDRCYWIGVLIKKFSWFRIVQNIIFLIFARLCMIAFV